MSRLEQVLERHQRRTRQTRGLIAWIVIVGGLFVAVVVLLIFTDLGVPPVTPGPAKRAVPAGSAASGSSAGSRVDGVLLGAPKRPASKPTRP